ncbi:Uncharacterized protein HZ326_18638, partial [Fusarium oxysporum f. sp. albedinis]
LRGAPADQRTARLFSMKYYVIEIHPSDCITPSPPPVRVSAYFSVAGDGYPSIVVASFFHFSIPYPLPLPFE